MSRIFISYRREDTSGYAGRLHDRLRTHFGEHQVFMDIDAIEPGLDYQDFIERTMDTVDIMVVLMGRQWLTAAGPAGTRRLDDPDDFVRLEIAGALRRQIRVIPVLVEGSTMPSVHDLPPPLVPLARRNAIEVSDSRWDFDCQRLTAVLDRALGGSEPARAAAAPRASSAAPNGSTEPARSPATAQNWSALTVVAATAAVAVLVWGVLAPRAAHRELAGFRIATEAILVASVAAGLWLKQYKWVLAGGIIGAVGLVAWIQFLFSDGHSVGDLFGSEDGASNILALVGSILVLAAGVVGTRGDRGGPPRCDAERASHR